MLVSESILEQALAQVFDGKAAGARMTLADISAAWSAVGLRKSDLRDAIREMIESHCLAPLNIAGHVSINHWQGKRSVNFQIVDAAKVFGG